MPLQGVREIRDLYLFKIQMKIFNEKVFQKESNFFKSLNRSNKKVDFFLTSFTFLLSILKILNSF